jgi:hypothetical protein
MLLPFHAVAHHSGAEYDRTMPMTFHATVVEFHFASPHPLLLVDENRPDTGKAIHWSVEIGPNPAELTRNGWGKKRSEAALMPGSVITLTILPSRENPTRGMAQKIIASDGEPVFGSSVLLQF